MVQSGEETVGMELRFYAYESLFIGLYLVTHVIDFHTSLLGNGGIGYECLEG